MLLVFLEGPAEQGASNVPVAIAGVAKYNILL
jgi:hypothetical protein